MPTIRPMRRVASRLRSGRNAGTLTRGHAGQDVAPTDTNRIREGTRDAILMLTAIVEPERERSSQSARSRSPRQAIPLSPSGSGMGRVALQY
jgi:hypothetical protein